MTDDMTYYIDDLYHGRDEHARTNYGYWNGYSDHDVKTCIVPITIFDC